MTLDLISAKTFHARRGAVANAFTYGVDFVLTDFSRTPTRLLSIDRLNLFSVNVHNHGGVRSAGAGVDWFRKVLTEKGFTPYGTQILLLTQPSFLWFHFNPVSFWIAIVAGKPRAIVAEVNNTYGQRHCYFCAHDDFRPIEWEDRLVATKLMHVSPFQDVAGEYAFNFDVTNKSVKIRIDYRNGDNGLLATLAGPRRRATDRGLLWSALRRPFGALRVFALIHWQALRLKLKKQKYLAKQPAPEHLVSDAQMLENANDPALR